VLPYVNGSGNQPISNTWDRVTTTQVPVAPTALLLLAALPLLVRSRKAGAPRAAIAA